MTALGPAGRLTPGDLAALAELADDLERIVVEVSSRDGDATARQHQRAAVVRKAVAALAAEGETPPAALQQAGTRLAEAARRYADRVEREAPAGQISTVAETWRLLAADWDRALAGEGETTPSPVADLARPDEKLARDAAPRYSQRQLDEATKPLHAEVARLTAERDRLREALATIEAHHAKLNDDAGRPQQNSYTLAIVRAALADTEGAR